MAAVTRGAALHCRKSGIAVRVNSIHPDGIWTPMMEASLRGAPPGIKPEHLLYDVKRNPKGAPACRRRWPRWSPSSPATTPRRSTAPS